MPPRFPVANPTEYGSESSSEHEDETASKHDDETAPKHDDETASVDDDEPPSKRFKLGSGMKAPPPESKEALKKLPRQPRGRKGKPGELCENHAICGRDLSGADGPGPGGSRLCDRCVQRWNKARKRAANAKEEIGEDWRRPNWPGKDELCENHANCGNDLSGRGSGKIPGGRRLCYGCLARWSKAQKKAATVQEEIGEDWRPLVRAPTGRNKEKKPAELCENYVNCGNDLSEGGTGTGPKGRLCMLCISRYRRAKKAGAAGDEVDEGWRKPGTGWGTKKKAAKPTELCENHGNCGNDLSGYGTGTGPSGRLCRPCVQRYTAAREAIEGWRKPGGKEKGIPPIELCENHGNCGNDLSGYDTGTGPKGRLCRPCVQRYDGAREATAAEDEVGEDWRLTPQQAKDQEREQQAKDQGRDKCRHCRRYRAGEEWGGSSCGPCHQRQLTGADPRPAVDQLHTLPEVSYAALRDLAYRQWRLLNSADPYFVQIDVPTTTRQYAHLTRDALSDECDVRGIKAYFKGHRSKSQLELRLQYDDAYNGIAPRPRPSGASDLHERMWDDLQRMATEAGYFREHGGEAPKTSAAFIAFLQQKRDASDDLRAIQVNKLAVIRDAVRSVLRMLGGDEEVANGITHQSHNGGITGSERALARLWTTLSHGRYPVRTSSQGLLCGPRALSTSLHALRRHYYGRPGYYPVEVTESELRQLLFLNIDGDEDDPDAIGVPTPEYEQYLHNRLGHLPEVERGNEYMNMTRLNNMDFQQLVAMLSIAHQHGRVEANFSVGIARSAHVDARGNTAPAFAQIVHEGDESAPTIWLHHNQAASDGDYNHWEGFGDPTDTSEIETAFEWGLSAPVTGDMEKKRFNRKAPESHKDDLVHLQAEVTNARANLRNYRNATQRACIPCRLSRQTRTCKRAGGHRYCDNCADHPDDCKWDEGSVESQLTDWKNGSEVTMEDIRDWDVPLSLIEEEQMLLSSRDHLPDPEPKGRHFLVIGCARRSDHPSHATLIQLLQDLILTINAYNNLLNNPAHQGSPEGQRPGGAAAALPMRSYRLAFGRHGPKAVPTQLANLNNVPLQAFVQFIDHLTRAGNPNIPVEIHFLLMGVAGFSVDIAGWGDRTQGFFRFILDRDIQNQTAIANTIYLVPAIELHVINQNSPSSINNGLPPHGIRNNNKQLIKYRLADLIDRHQDLKQAAHQMQMPWQQFLENMSLLHQGLPVAVPVNLPAWAGGAQQAVELDRFIMAMYWEKAWRSAWLGANTIPSAYHVAQNNVGRNTRMQG